MTTTNNENNIRAMELLADELLREFNEAICEYDDAIDHPDYYDVELARKAMDEAERNYRECLDEIEWMRTL